MKTQSITEWVNSLSPEQYCRMIDAISPLGDNERAKYDAMSDDDLLNELFEQCATCGEHHEDVVPFGCRTGDGE